ncbi:MAG TPA: cytochrome b N-terminal domain-containing protein [Terriglobales bacterium]|nr:cytochrome b N-terminal domain-containing protein [Terriglobales bacterium]
MNPPPEERHSRFRAWLDSRTGLDSLLRHALDEPIPGGAKIAYVFGSGLLFLFVSQIVTGVFLAMYYVPSADHAHTTVEYITKEVTSGSFLRGLHAYGSSAIIIVLLLHITQTFLYGSYKGRRELVWLAGCVLLMLMLGMAFTGYLLPWDQKAYFATTVGTNILSELPWIGNALKRLLRGGTEMGTLTLSRFFVLHVFLIPAFIFAFVAIHVYFFRKSGAAGPIGEDPLEPKLQSEPFYPKQLVMDMGFTILIIVALGIIAYFWPTELGPKADPSDTQFLPRPEWYYIPVFQYLKYWHGSTSLIGILLIPGIVGLLLVTVPFFDRSLERRPWKRPVSVGLFAVILLALGGLGLLSHREDLRNPGLAAQLKAQRDATKEFMQAKFEPELSGGSLLAENAALANPGAAKGKEIFEGQSCNACHGDNGVGTAAAPKLIGVGEKYTSTQIEVLLQKPNEQMTAGGMPPVNLKDDEMKALIDYLRSLK